MKMESMRQIKFKGNSRDTKNWVYGSLVKTPFGTFIEWYEDSVCNKVEIDPSTVCQYTGLIDENGVELYEGDYIKILDEERLIEYNPVACGFILQETPARTMRSLDVLASYAFEVIGNKFDKEESK